MLLRQLVALTREPQRLVVALRECDVAGIRATPLRRILGHRRHRIDEEFSTRRPILGTARQISADE